MHLAGMIGIVEEPSLAVGDEVYAHKINVNVYMH